MNASLMLIQRALKPLRGLLTQLFLRGRVEHTDDSSPFQKLQIRFSSEEVQNNVERIQNFGFRSHPPKGSEVFCAFLGGKKDYPMILAADHRTKQIEDLKEGETAVYNQEGSQLLLKKNGEFVLKDTHQIFFLIQDGEIILENQNHSKLALKKNGKFIIHNGNHDLITLLVELVEKISAIQIGPHGGPLLPPTLGELQALKTKLEGFKP